MDIKVEHKDVNGTTFNRTFHMNRLAFTKHLALAGQGYLPSPQILLRTLAMFLHYSYYLNNQAFKENRFSEPTPQLSDPTEKGQFSNLVGKAIADFLSKRIDHCLYTVNYEAVMRLRGFPINVGRADLLAYTQNSMFSIEAKGFSGGHGNMKKHKLQASSGGIPVNFSVACISYDLYNDVKCKYHDPFRDNVPYDNISLSALSRLYYDGLLKFLTQELFVYNEVTYQGEKFYEVELSRDYFSRFSSNEFPYHPFWHVQIFTVYKPKLILPYKVREYAEKGISNEIRPFIFETNSQDDSIYIDNDRVGLRVENNTNATPWVW